MCANVYQCSHARQCMYRYVDVCQRAAMCVKYVNVCKRTQFDSNICKKYNTLWQWTMYGNVCNASCSTKLGSATVIILSSSVVSWHGTLNTSSYRLFGLSRAVHRKWQALRKMRDCERGCERFRSAENNPLL